MFTIKSSGNIVAPLAGVKSFAATDFKTKEPKIDPETGLQLWQFSIMVPNEYRYEQMSVKTYAKEDPLVKAGAVMGDSVELSGVTVDLGTMSSGDGKPRQFWRIMAESVLVKKQKA